MPFLPVILAGRAGSSARPPLPRVADARALNPTAPGLSTQTVKRIDTYITFAIRSRIARYVWMTATITNTMLIHR